MKLTLFSCNIFTPGAHALPSRHRRPFLRAEQNGGELRYCYNLRGKIARL
jgi:hypothetical protein